MYIIVTSNEMLAKMAKKAGDQVVQITSDSGVQVKSNVDCDLDSKIENLLIDLGLKTSLKGFLFSKMAIKLIAGYRKNVNILTVIYPLVAESQSTTISSIERSIRHSIECASRVPTTLFLQIFGKSLPTSKEFLYRLATCVSKN